MHISKMNEEVPMGAYYVLYGISSWYKGVVPSNHAHGRTTSKLRLMQMLSVVGTYPLHFQPYLIFVLLAILFFCITGISLGASYYCLSGGV